MAVTLRAADIVTVQVDVPEHAPPHPTNREEALTGVAVRMTEVPKSKSSAQSAPHAIPDGALDTEPAPLPVSRTLRARVLSRKFAVTLRARVTLTVHVALVPEQAPPHPAKTDPVEGVARRVTSVPKS